MVEASVLPGTVYIFSMPTDEWHLEPFGELGQDEMVIQDPPSVDIAFPPLRETTSS